MATKRKVSEEGPQGIRGVAGRSPAPRGSPALGLCLRQLQAGLRQHRPRDFLVVAPVVAEEALGLAVEVLVARRAGCRPPANGS